MDVVGESSDVVLVLTLPSQDGHLDYERISTVCVSILS